MSASSGPQQETGGTSGQTQQATLSAFAASFIRWGAPLSRAIRVRALVMTLISSFAVLLGFVFIGIPTAIFGAAVDALTGATDFFVELLGRIEAGATETIGLAFQTAGISIGGGVLPGTVVGEHIGGFVAGIAIAAVTAWSVNFMLSRIAGPSPFSVLRGGR